MDLLIPDSGLVFWQLIGFLALLFILSKFAWGPILTTLRERENSIEQSLEAAQIARNEMKMLQAENEKLLDEARLERDKILNQALIAANNIKEEAKVESTKIGNKIVADAKAAIDIEKQAALTEMKNQVAILSVEIAEKLLRKELNNETSQKLLVQDYINDLNVN
ncbi:MAG: F0F1 ATP synthase subunit B [Bacteroidota bacterium]|jgi:F-type H+-transporting ATPase subunit b|nr:F0F1 ATP synthase subunit B [Bacteroidota bacterium]